MRFPVYFHKTIEATVWVEADDPVDADELANDQITKVDSLCAHCSGYGKPWSVDDAGEWEFTEVGDPR